MLQNDCSAQITLFIIRNKVWSIPLPLLFIMNSSSCHLPHLFDFTEEISFSLAKGFDMNVEVFLLFFVPQFCLCDGEDFCREATSSQILHNHALLGHVIKSLLTRGIFSCAHKCLSLTSCSSYNYQTSATQDGICELNAAGGNEDSHWKNVTGKHGFAFAKVRRKQVRIIIIIID